MGMLNVLEYLDFCSERINCVIVLIIFYFVIYLFCIYKDILMNLVDNLKCMEVVRLGSY